MLDAAPVVPCLGCAPVMRIRDGAEKLGVSRREVHRLLQHGALVRLDRQLVVGACLVERGRTDRVAAHRLRLDALLATYPGAYASAHSAAVVHQLPTFEMPAFAVATRASGAWRGGEFGRLRIGPLPAHHVTTVADVPVMSLARTVVDIGRASTRRSAVVTGDAALRRGLSRNELAGVLDECATWSDVGKARLAIGFMDPRAESALESLSRVVFAEREVPAPELQVEITVSAITHRVDFLWREARLIGEADGRAKYSSDERRTPEQVLWAEKLREDALRDAGYRVVRWTYGQLLNETDAVIERIMRRLR